MSDDDKIIQFKAMLEEHSEPYQKIDHVQAARLEGDFSVLFYQSDYHSIATKLGETDGDGIVETKLIPVARFVMNEKTFRELNLKIQEILEKFEKRK